jgi:RNA polymerase sigma-54 factor
VLVDRRYYARVSRQAKTKKEKEYLSDRLNSANWLVKSLDQRANTIIRVGSELVRQQNGFFVNGVQHLRPLIMRDVAEAIEMHESTVSRVTANKYMSTPRGTFEMRYFFTNAIANTRGDREAHSSEAVRQRIKSLIAAEDPKTTLSDDRIVAVLKGNGIDIARRTVAKYREMLRIPSSLERRRQKRRQK